MGVAIPGSGGLREDEGLHPAPPESTGRLEVKGGSARSQGAQRGNSSGSVPPAPGVPSREPTCGHCPPRMTQGLTDHPHPEPTPAASCPHPRLSRPGGHRFCIQSFSDLPTPTLPTTGLGCVWIGAPGQRAGRSIWEPPQVTPTCVWSISQWTPASAAGTH